MQCSPARPHGQQAVATLTQIEAFTHPLAIAGRARSEIDLSVVLCTFQGERWLPDLLASIGAQTRLPTELVVFDDGSDDRSVAIVEEFARSTPIDVRVTRNDVRVGSTRNFERALAASRGEVVALADQDDVWYPQKLETMCIEFELDPTISMVFSDADLIDENGTPLGRRLWRTRLVDRTLRRHAVVSEDLLARRALTTGCTMAIRRRAINAARPFPDEIDAPEAIMRHDRWLSLVAAAVGIVRALPEPLLAFRVHPSQETGVLVGGQLHRALWRATTSVASRATGAGHEARANQLEAAADRAEAIGDFREAGALRSVAAHQRDRAAIGTRNHGPIAVINAARAGAYWGDPLSVAAIGADLVRSLPLVRTEAS